MKSTTLLAFLLSLSTYSTSSFATGPRVKPSIFLDDTNQLYTVNLPPFINSKTGGRGLLLEIINTILKAENITGKINILPSKNMTQYYFSQENALAIIGHDFNFSKKTQQKSIFIPILSVDEYYYTHASAKQEIQWQGELASFKNKVFGTSKGNNISQYKAAGIHIKYGRMHTLLQKMKTGQIDFIKSSQLSFNAALNDYFPKEQQAFIKLEPKASETSLGIVFNNQHADGKKSAEKFKTGLNKIITNGELTRILQKHLGHDTQLEPYLQHKANR